MFVVYFGYKDIVLAQAFILYKVLMILYAHTHNKIVDGDRYAYLAYRAENIILTYRRDFKIKYTDNIYYFKKSYDSTGCGIDTIKPAGRAIHKRGIKQLCAEVLLKISISKTKSNIRKTMQSPFLPPLFSHTVSFGHISEM